MGRHRYETLARLREVRLPKPERQAARAERAVERQFRLERDNLYSAERRAAAREAEARRDGHLFGDF